MYFNMILLAPGLLINIPKPSANTSLPDRLRRGQSVGIVSIKDNGYLLQSIAAGFRIEEVGRGTVRGADGHEDEVVLPRNCF